MKQLVAFLVLCLPFILSAQTAPAPNFWNISLQGGLFVSGLPSSLEDKLRSQGYQETNSWLSGDDIPMTRQNPVFQFGLERITAKSWSGKLLLSALEGRLNGVHNQAGDLRLEYIMVSSALLAGYHSKQRITRIALGPAVHFIRMSGEKNSIYYDPVEKNFTRLGLVAEAGLRFPANRRFFCDLSAQYNLLGELNIGSFVFEGEDVSGQPTQSSFLAGKESFDYFSLNIGLGVRFGEILK